jgi:hypothetical protein
MKYFNKDSFSDIEVIDKPNDIYNLHMGVKDIPIVRIGTPIT